jgi:hypothetical protein
MSEQTERKPSRDLSIPIVWGVAAGLFVAVLLRGALGGGIVLVLSLLTFAAVISTATGRNLLERRAPRMARVVARRPRRTARPPSSMLVAAVGSDMTTPAARDDRTQAALRALGAADKSQIAAWTPAAAGRKEGAAESRATWMGQAERIAFGRRDDTDSDAAAKQG